MVEDIEAIKADYEKKLNASGEKITLLEGEVEKLKNSVAEVETLKASVVALGEEFKIKNAAEVAAKDAVQKEEFKKKNLNAAAATEIDAIWPQVKDLNPIEFDQWKINNSSKLLTEAEKRTPLGKKQMDAAGDLQGAAHAALAKVGA